MDDSDDSDSIVSTVSVVRIPRVAFRARLCYVEWSTSGFEEDPLMFYEKLRQTVPEGTEIYGGRGRTIDSGRWKYCAVMRLPPLLGCFFRGYNAEMFEFRRDDGALVRAWVEILTRRETEREFLVRTQAYCTPPGTTDTFGTPIEVAEEELPINREMFGEDWWSDYCQRELQIQMVETPGERESLSCLYLKRRGERPLNGKFFC